MKLFKILIKSTLCK